MNMNPLSNTPVVNVMLLGVDARKSAVFGMAFKMHTSTEYRLVNDAHVANVLVVDIDAVDGRKLWQHAKTNLSHLPRVYSSVLEPDFDVAYLPKPIKIETLFPVLRAALTGAVTFKAAEAEERSHTKERLSFKEQAKNYKTTVAETVAEEEEQVQPREVNFPGEQIQFFDAEAGLLGALRKVAQSQENIAVLSNNKPVFMYFADIERVLLAVAPDKLEEMCSDADLELTVKNIGDHPEWKQHAKAQLDTCLWQFAIWTAHGRLPAEIDINRPVSLRSWPNITRLAYIPDAMRLSAFLTKAPVSLPMVYKMIRVDIGDLVNFVTACYVTKLLQVQTASPAGAAHVEAAATTVHEHETAHHVATNTAAADAAPAPVRKQPNSMLKRLLRKLTGK